jgi:hypothetical protein
VGAKYVVRRQKTQIVLNENFYDTERASGCCPWESLHLAALESLHLVEGSACELGIKVLVLDGARSITSPP